LGEADARCQQCLLRCYQDLLRLSHFGLRKSKCQRRRLARRNLALNHSKDLQLKGHHALGEMCALLLDEHSVKRRVHVTVDSPAQLLDFGVSEVPKPIGCVDSKTSLATDLELLH
jgi:hypothetical protein